MSHYSYQWAVNTCQRQCWNWCDTLKTSSPTISLSKLKIWIPLLISRKNHDLQLPWIWPWPTFLIMLYCLIQYTSLLWMNFSIWFSYWKSMSDWQTLALVTFLYDDHGRHSSLCCSCPYKWVSSWYYSASCFTCPRVWMGYKHRYMEFGMLGKSPFIVTLLSVFTQVVSFLVLQIYNQPLALCSTRETYMDCRSILSHSHAHHGCRRLQYWWFSDQEAHGAIFQSWWQVEKVIYDGDQCD